MKKSDNTTIEKIVILHTYDNDVWADVQDTETSYTVRHVSAEYRIESVIKQYEEDGFIVDFKE